MKLFEVLDKHVEWEWEHNEAEGGVALFKIGEYYYRVIFEHDHNYYDHAMDDMEHPPEFFTGIMILIRHEDDNQWTSTATNTGNEFQVFATVSAIMQEFIKQHKPEAISFSAHADEPTRVRLYKRFVRKLATIGYHEKFSDRDGVALVWVLVKE